MAAERKMQKTILGFVPYYSPIYKIHPLLRLIIYLITGFLPLFVEIPELNLLFVLIIFIMFNFSGVDIKRLKIYVPMMFTVACFITLTYTFFPIEKGVKILLFSIGRVQVYFNSIFWALCIYCRILALLFASILYFSTNRERDIIIAFRSIGLPFIATYFIGLSLRSAGIFMEDYQIIREAEQARGLDVSNLSFMGKIKHFSMYMVPLFTLSIRRCEEISVGLFAKGTIISNKVDGKKRPDYLLSKAKLSASDKFSAALILIAFLAVVSLQVFLRIFAVDYSPIYNLFLGMLGWQRGVR